MFGTKSTVNLRDGFLQALLDFFDGLPAVKRRLDSGNLEVHAHNYNSSMPVRFELNCAGSVLHDILFCAKKR